MSEIDVGELVTIDQVMARAEEMLDPGPHGWAEAGAGDEITLTRNRVALNGLALVPRAVGLGRLQCWALAVGSTAGLVRVLEILAEELRVTMANLGCRDVNEVTADLVRWSIPVSPPPMPRHSGRRRVRNEPPVPGAG